MSSDSSASSSAALSWLHLFLDVPRRDFTRARDFWAEVLWCTPSTRRGEDGQFITLLPERGPSWIKMQAVDGQPGVHLDLDTVDRDAAVARSLAAGATYVSTYDDVVVHRSPGGLTFCHTLGEPQRVSNLDRPLIDQVTIEVPAVLWHEELEFWCRVLGRSSSPGPYPEFARLLSEGQPRVMLLRLDEQMGAVKAHPDLPVADRTAAMRRHIELGAEVQVLFDYWTVMRAPGGHTYCLTDRHPGVAPRPVAGD